MTARTGERKPNAWKHADPQAAYDEAYKHALRVLDALRVRLQAEAAEVGGGADWGDVGVMGHAAERIDGVFEELYGEQES